MRDRPSFEEVYMQFAETISRRSTCTRLSVGTVITTTDYRKVLAVGYNGNASGLDNGQPLPSINSMDRPRANADGSIDIYFGPERYQDAENWLRTVPGKSWFTILRLYGPDKPYFDNTWKPDDIVKVR